MEPVSARLDNEDSESEREATTAHLRACAACRGFAERATRVTQLARAGVAGHVPDIAEPVIEAVYPSGRPPREVDSRVPQSTPSRLSLRLSAGWRESDDRWNRVVQAALWCGCPCCRRLLGQLTPWHRSMV
jgi:Putative zinc-finger